MCANRYINEATQNQVRQRAKFLCEYCHTRTWQYVSCTVDHVIPLTKGGTNSIDNLALACFHYNRQKSARMIAFDIQSFFAFNSGLIYNLLAIALNAQAESLIKADIFD